MYTVLVAIRVRPDQVEAFETAIAENAAASVRDETGCLVFEVHQSTANPLDYLLYEIYTDEQAFTIDHKAGPHYAAWQASAARCLEPGGRTNTYYRPVLLTPRRSHGQPVGELSPGLGKGELTPSPVKQSGGSGQV